MPKFIQILEVARVLFALDESGTVWYYKSAEDGWESCNAKRTIVNNSQ